MEMIKKGIIVFSIMFVWSCGNNESTSINLCQQKVEGIGLCEAIVFGVEYDSQTGKCENVKLSGRLEQIH